MIQRCSGIPLTVRSPEIGNFGHNDAQGSGNRSPETETMQFGF